MKEQYIITDRDGDTLGTQMAGYAQRAIHLFATRHNLVACHLKAVRFVDWRPLRAAGTDHGNDSIEF